MKLDGNTSDWIKRKKDNILAPLKDIAPPEMEDMGNPAIQAGLRAKPIADQSAAQAAQANAGALPKDENKVSNTAWNSY